MSFKNRNPKAAGPLRFAHYGLNNLAQIETGSAGAAIAELGVKLVAGIPLSMLRLKRTTDLSDHSRRQDR